MIAGTGVVSTGVRSSEELGKKRRSMEETSGGVVERCMKDGGGEDPRLGTCGAEHTSEHGLLAVEW